MMELCQLALLSLPKEILIQILSHLEYDALSACYRTSKRFNNFMTRNKIWRSFALCDECIPFEGETDFKLICNQKHVGKIRLNSDDKLIQTVGRLQVSILHKEEVKVILEELKKLAHNGASIQHRMKEEGIVRTLAILGRLYIDDLKLMHNLISFFFVGSNSIYLYDDKEGYQTSHILKEQKMMEITLSLFKKYKGSSDIQLLNYICSLFAHQSVVEGNYLIGIGLMDELIYALKSTSNSKILSPILKTILSFAKYVLSSKENLSVAIFEVLVSFITKDPNITIYCLNILEAISHYENSALIGGLPSLLESIILNTNLSLVILLKSWAVYSKILQSPSNRLFECLHSLSALLRKESTGHAVNISETLLLLSMNHEILKAMLNIGMMKQVIELMSKCSNAVALNNLCNVLLNASQLRDEILEDVFAARIMDNVISICEAGQKTNSLEAAKKLHQKSNFFCLF